MKRIFIVIIFFFISGISVFSNETAELFDSSSTFFSVNPGIDYPIETGKDLLTLGAQVDLSSLFSPFPHCESTKELSNLK